MASATPKSTLVETQSSRPIEQTSRMTRSNAKRVKTDPTIEGSNALTSKPIGATPKPIATKRKSNGTTPLVKANQTQPTTPMPVSCTPKSSPLTPADTPSQSGPEEFVKYYKCLTASFNKIQTKDQKVSLTNAARRPKIIEYFREHDDVLTSYLNYLQVFLRVYPEQFEDVCKTVVLPLFKMDTERDECQVRLYKTVHHALAEVISDSHDLAEELIACLTRNFPFYENATTLAYLNYVYNYLRACLYLPDTFLKSSFIALIDKLMWLDLVSDDEQLLDGQEKKLTELSNQTIELVYEFVDEAKQGFDTCTDNFFFSFIGAFQKVILSTARIKKIHQLVFYLCSIKSTYAEALVNSLWETTIESNRGFEERKAAIAYVSSLLSRAIFLEIDLVLEYIAKALAWCHSFIDVRYKSSRSSSGIDRRMSSGKQSDAVFYLVCQSVFYILTQRHRDLYDEDVVRQLRRHDLSGIVNKKLKPLQSCDPVTCSRFEEVAHMYKLAHVLPENSYHNIKNRFDDVAEVRASLNWQLPFEESGERLSERLNPLYRVYYNHSNFTVYRDE